MVTHFTVTEQIQVLRARLELNQKAVARLRHMLAQRHDFYFQPVGDVILPPTVLHDFHDPFDLVIQQVILDKDAQIREDQKTLAGVRGHKI